MGNTLIPWGGQLFPSDFGPMLDHNFCVLGCPGSGKTLMIRMLMAAVLRCQTQRQGVFPRFRSIIFDPKRDMVPVLLGMGIPEGHIAILNPFDARATYWDVAEDIQNDADILQLAAAIVPVADNTHNEFFYTAAQRLVVGVLTTFVEQRRARGAGHSWTLNDVVEVCSGQASREAVLKGSLSGRQALEMFFADDASGARGQARAQDILMTLETRLMKLRPIAAAMARLGKVQGRKPVSVRAWAKAGAASTNLQLQDGDPQRLLILGWDARFSEVLDPLNRLIMQRAMEQLLQRPEERPRDLTWFFLDEVRLVGKMESLPKLVVGGRSKGVHVVLGFQDIAGMREVYGEDLTDELVGNCGNLALLRTSSPTSMNWAAERAGRVEEFMTPPPSMAYQRSGSASKRNGWQTSWSVTETHTPQMHQKDKVLPNEFSELPPASLQLGIPGFFYVPSMRNCWRGPISPNYLAQHLYPTRGLGYSEYASAEEEAAMMAQYSVDPSKWTSGVIPLLKPPHRQQLRLPDGLGDL